ncbi:hypothetical protein BV20DRAFT_590646 [Pilatotrama ljubarskyi]|nr:hypothetical protein BV20DRAFT_590646 [Pilatotrama ljubarskyi]
MADDLERPRRYLQHEQLTVLIGNSTLSCQCLPALITRRVTVDRALLTTRLMGARNGETVQLQSWVCFARPWTQLLAQLDILRAWHIQSAFRQQFKLYDERPENSLRVSSSLSALPTTPATVTTPPPLISCTTTIVESHLLPSGPFLLTPVTL